jgi:hypothetical protein
LVINAGSFNNGIYVPSSRKIHLYIFFLFKKKSKLPSIRVNTQRACDGKRRRSGEKSFESVDDRLNGSPLFIKHKSNLIAADNEQRDRI